MLSADNLSCRRGGRIVFRAVGFTVTDGSFLQVTGANGSGKSSLLRVLAGLLVPHQGAVCWQNTDINADSAAHRQRLHYIGHLDALKPELTVTETLHYWGAVRGFGSVDAGLVLEAFGLGPLAGRAVRSLSAGQKRRLSLTRLRLDHAPLWLLDEPATALDKAGRELLLIQIARHRAQGGIVIAATHDELNIVDAQRAEMGSSS